MALVLKLWAIQVLLFCQIPLVTAYSDTDYSATSPPTKGIRSAISRTITVASISPIEKIMNRLRISSQCPSGTCEVTGSLDERQDETDPSMGGAIGGAMGVLNGANSVSAGKRSASSISSGKTWFDRLTRQAYSDTDYSAASPPTKGIRSAILGTRTVASTSPVKRMIDSRRIGSQCPSGTCEVIVSLDALQDETDPSIGGAIGGAMGVLNGANSASAGKRSASSISSGKTWFDRLTRQVNNPLQ